MTEFGEELFAPANGLQLCYQEMGDPDGEPLLLVMGLATQLLGWDERFCALLAERGFRVVRFDNRDIGRSTKLSSAGAPSLLDTALGRRASATYLLRDMAADSFGLMDHLGWESAHVVGASMGGMIVQTMAIERPERVRSLVSMMSTTGNRWTGLPTAKTLGILVAKRPNDRDAFIERGVQTFRLIGSPGYPYDEERVREMSARAFDRGVSASGVARQLHAITASGDRTRGLESLDLPATVIHGNRDPLIRTSGGRATAAAIPNSRLKIIDGMGHDLPRQLHPTFADEIEATAALAGAVAV
ncbi:MAG: alpha/beta fold hydrolase [Solirubrobacterales bacterium]